MIQRKYDNPCRIRIRRSSDNMFILSVEDYETYVNKKELLGELSSCIDNIKL